MLKLKAKYNTWIRFYKLLIFLVISLILLSVTIFPVNTSVRVLSGILAVPFLYRVKWDGDGTILDIGTGSGSLIIKLAKAFPAAVLTGIDYWGDNWEYSKAQCQQNAEIEGVSHQIHFQKASASELPFNENEFDIIVSCLTFHEVKDRSNKIDVIKEALRVLKPGGKFAFLDLFMDEKIFGDENELLNDLKKYGISELNSSKLDKEIKLPKFLLNKKVLGNAVILSGRK
ncbi:class I SAM-dependent methyltransferase [Gottfriedia acidiceleris]|uniref:class I SAM-dependent methyltransferase n=1 Tax=Gottfriedia acidiceleris TaxID=371036 RepID=UPI002FFFE34C